MMTSEREDARPTIAVYPRLTALGVTIHDDPIPHVTWSDLMIALGTDRYHDFLSWMTGQTCIEQGAYLHDVERFLASTNRSTPVNTL